jgi:osmotically inducible protein OsmC
MPRIERSAAVVWEGNLARGEGRISAASSGAFSALRYSNATRIGSPAGNTSPEELLAAAHAACFANSLAAELSVLGTPPGRLELTCRVVMDEVAGEGHRIVASELSLAAAVAGLDAAGLDAAVSLADAGCPFSNLLKAAGVRVEIGAGLLGSDGEAAPLP